MEEIVSTKDLFGDKEGETISTAELFGDAPARYSGEDMSGPEKFLAGVGKGMADIGIGATQRILEGGEFLRNILGLESNSENIQKLKNLVEQNREAFKPLAESSTAAKGGEFLGQVAPTAVIPGGVAGGTLKRAGTAMLSGGATGAVQPTGENDSVALNTGIGMAGGSAGSAAMSGMGKLYNSIKGKLPPNVAEDLAKKWGIRTTLGEATDNPLTKKVETWLEALPTGILGLKGFREKQKDEAEQAAKNLLAKYIADPSAPDIMQANRDYAGSLFENLRKTIDGIQDQSINPTATKDAAAELLKRYPDIFKKFQDTKREGIIQDVLKGSDSPISFNDAWTLRNGLGEMIGQARKKLASGEVDKTTYGEISRLYKAVNKDIESWADSLGRGDVKALIKDANDSYKQYVVKYDIIQRAMDKAEGAVGAGEMFSPKKMSTALKNIAYKNKEMKTFSASEIDEMTGLANVLQVVKRAGQFAENPPTGNRWGLPTTVAAVMAGTALTNPGAVAGEGGVLLLTRFLTGTQSGKRLAMAASKIEPDSDAMKSLVNVIYNQLPKMAATGGASRSY